MMAEEEKIYDLAGIGIGPFNLSMAALLEDNHELEAVFFDESPSFQWHPGMLIEETDLQVPFLADLVTFADPSSRFSFLNYLHKHNRLYKFYFFNRFDIPRREYNDYAQWVAEQLSNCMFGERVIDIIDNKDSETPHYEVVTENRETKEKKKFASRNIALGTGSTPMVPGNFSDFPEEDVFHTASYQYLEEEISEAESILVTGSGQSAAEVFLDLLEKKKRDQKLTWLTRSPGFFQLESGKLGQEIFSHDYIDYFHPLPFEKRQEELPHLNHLRKGVEQKTFHKIYDLLYHYSVQNIDPGITIGANMELKEIEREQKAYRLTFEHKKEEQKYLFKADKVILATGYKPNIPEWLNKLRDEIEWEDEKRFKVTRDYQLSFKGERPHKIYSLTNLEHSHGAGATNLALSVGRNVTIINSIAGKQVYQEQDNTVFQSFTFRD
jgi:lysine N6-hydroxylase